MREAVGIRRREGVEGRVLNSKSEFNRSHIPRRVLELEGEDVKTQRIAQEQKDREELEQVFNNLNLTWEEKKARAMELEVKKRRRNSEKEGGTKPPKRQRKIKYTVIREQWGEESCDEDELGATGQDCVGGNTKRNKDIGSSGEGDV